MSAALAEDITVTPLWFDYLLVVAACGVLGVGGVGLLLADIGQYRASWSIWIGLVAAAVAVILVRPRSRSLANTSSIPIRIHLVCAGICLVAFGQAIWNFAYAGHHVAVDRDPGIYVVTARWLARNPSLSIPAGLPWAHLGLNLGTVSAGFAILANGSLQFQGAHLLPVLMAQGFGIAGNAAMFRIPALVGAIGLCLIFRVACEVVHRPTVALAAVTGLAVSLPELAFTRDAFSEPVVQLLLWAGIWLILRCYREQRGGCGFVAGLFVGATLMAHIDSFAFLLPLPLLAALAWLVDRQRVGTRRMLKLFGCFFAGVVLTAGLGTFDVRYRSPYYYHRLGHEVDGLYLGLAFTVVVSLLVVIASPLSRRVGRWLVDHRRALATASFWIIVLGLGAAWTLRPVGPKTTTAVGSPGIAALQRISGLPFAPTRLYNEETMRWFQWYLGPLTVALGIIGIALLVVRAIRSHFVEGIVFVTIAAPLTAYYLWNPSIVPDQIWASRRFFAIGFPLFALAAAYSLDRLVSFLGERQLGAAWQRRGIALGSVAMVAFPLATTLPVRSFQPQANYLPVVQTICEKLGPNAQVLFPAQEASDTFILLAQTLRSFCNVPTALLRTRQDTPAAVRVAAERLQARHKTLWLLAGSSANLEPFATGTPPQLLANALSPHEIAQTLETPPDHYTAEDMAVFYVEIS